jgi:putative toxin-antitoxin system antitoxin component (TIGR02293 family)
MTETKASDKRQKRRAARNVRVGNNKATAGRTDAKVAPKYEDVGYLIGRGNAKGGVFHVEKGIKDYWAKLDIPSRGQDLLEAVNAGLKVETLDKFIAVIGVDTKRAVKMLRIRPRNSLKDRLSVQESDRVVMAAKAFKAAIDLFEGDEEKARHWMSRPARGLGGKVPESLLGTSSGVEAVMDLIERLEHGVVA